MTQVPSFISVKIQRQATKLVLNRSLVKLTYIWKLTFKPEDVLVANGQDLVSTSSPDFKDIFEQVVQNMLRQGGTFYREFCNLGNETLYTAHRFSDGQPVCIDFAVLSENTDIYLVLTDDQLMDRVLVSANDQFDLSHLAANVEAMTDKPNGELIRLANPWKT